MNTFKLEFALPSGNQVKLKLDLGSFILTQPSKKLALDHFPSSWNWGKGNTKLEVELWKGGVKEASLDLIQPYYSPPYMMSGVN